MSCETRNVSRTCDRISWLYPLRKSNFEHTLAPLRSTIMSSTVGMMCLVRFIADTNLILRFGFWRRCKPIYFLNEIVCFHNLQFFFNVFSHIKKVCVCVAIEQAVHLGRCAGQFQHLLACVCIQISNCMSNKAVQIYYCLTKLLISQELSVTQQQIHSLADNHWNLLSHKS